MVNLKQEIRVEPDGWDGDTTSKMVRDIKDTQAHESEFYNNDMPVVLRHSESKLYYFRRYSVSFETVDCAITKLYSIVLDHMCKDGKWLNVQYTL